MEFRAGVGIPEQLGEGVYKACRLVGWGHMRGQTCPRQKGGPAGVLHLGVQAGELSLGLKTNSTCLLIQEHRLPVVLGIRVTGTRGGHTEGPGCCRSGLAFLGSQS